MKKMTPKQLEINKLVTKYSSDIDKLWKKIKSVRSKCRHPKRFRTKIHKSNTGNYNPHQDSYWTENTCHICNKYWTEDQ